MSKLFRANKQADNVDDGSDGGSWCCGILLMKTPDSGRTVIDCSGDTSLEAVLLAAYIEKLLNDNLNPS